MTGDCSRMFSEPHDGDQPHIVQSYTGHDVGASYHWRGLNQAIKVGARAFKEIVDRYLDIVREKEGS